MSLPTNATTNEFKNSSGTEVEFLHKSLLGQKKVYAQKDENPSLKHRITVQHEEQGVGTKAKRRSNANIVKEVLSGVDSVTPVPIIASLTVQVPVGHMVTLTEVKNVVAELMSGLATTGAATTVLTDCTGTLADALVNGSL
jgi:hypothetical protein